jgi:probable F420-dependent oxidoreductase
MGTFRFGLHASVAKTGDELRDLARRAQGSGYRVLSIADHLGIIDPFVGCAVAAEVTESLRVGTLVLNIDFHPVALLARSAATLDLVSAGRLELGIGAGHMRSEYDEAALAFDRPGRRIDRMAESIDMLRGLFGGEEFTFEGVERRLRHHTLAPLPPQGAELPILVGGNGDRVLEVAATKADIVGFTGFRYDVEKEAAELSHLSRAGLADRVAHVRSFGTDPELQALIQRVVITDDARGAAARTASELGNEWNADDVLDSPFVLVGSVDAISEELVQRRQEFGISYFTFIAGRSSPEIDRIVERLAGT